MSLFSRTLPLFRSMTTRTSQHQNLATLRVHGPDGKGIVAACSNLLDRTGFGIVGTEHWTDRKENLLFLRIAFDKDRTTTTTTTATSNCNDDDDHDDHYYYQETENLLSKFCTERKLHYDINWRLRKAKVAIMVSKYDHCLWELLLRHEAKELDCDIVCVLSNHEDLRSVVEDIFGIPYYVFPITPSTKQQQEQAELDLLTATTTTTTKSKGGDSSNAVDIVVLARYMQVLSTNFLNVFPNSIINIHHSFLPAFSGSKPYHAAHDRGVKLIGATAHYTTPILDEGPIIEQDVIGVTHRDGVGELIKKGRILERNVLVRALQAHLDDRVIVYKNKCVVFGD